MATYLILVGAIGFALLIAEIGSIAQITQRQFLAFIAIAGGRSVYSVSRQLYKATGNPAIAMWINTVRDVIFLPAFLVAIAFGADALIVVVVRASVITFLAAVAFVRIGMLPKLPDETVGKRAYEYVRWRMPSKFISTTLGRLPILLLGGLVGSSAVGIYQAAYRITELGPYIGTCVKEPLHIKVSAITSTGRDASAYVKNAVGYTPIVAIPVLFVVIAFPSQILSVLYGEQFAAGGLALVIIAVGELLFAVTRTLKGAINGSDEPKSVLKADIATIVIGLPFGVVATLQYGVVGGAALFFLTEAIMYIIVQYSAYQLFGIGSFGNAALLWFLAGGVLTTIVIRSMLFLTTPTSIPEPVRIIGIGLLPYLAVPFTLHETTRTGVIKTIQDLQTMLNERM